jgi:AcrR family transcriptional regulator
VAWDTEGTKRRLKAAATAEFAEFGPDGTTMTRIAARAGINKERLYNYFGDKQALWEAVIADELERLAASVEVPERGFADIGEFAGRTFDYHAAHPELARLLQWEGLSGRPAAHEASRTAHYREKVARIADAQRLGIVDGGIDPGYLAYLLIALAAWWITVPQLATMIVGSGPSEQEHARRRAWVAQAAERLAAPRSAE